MTNLANDIEAFVNTADFDAIVIALATAIGEFKADPSNSDHLKIYHCGSVILALMTSVEGYWSVWLRDCKIWQSCPALARYLAGQMHRIVRCDPGTEYPDVSPYSDLFLQVDGSNHNLETLVSWDDANDPGNIQAYIS